MGKSLQDYIKIYISKLKTTTNTNTTTTATNWLLSACNHPKTLSFADVDRTAKPHQTNQLFLENDEDAILTDIRSSKRFFATPALSHSLIEEARLSATTTATTTATTPDESVAVMTFSKSPYDDFRQSMEEMMEVRQSSPSQPLDWDYMEELLLCYLDLNDRAVHKYILSAFADLTATYSRPEKGRNGIVSR